MIYTCLDCKYEFSVNEISHIHATNFINLKGCPICLKNLAAKKVCPKCNSQNLSQKLSAK